MDYTEILAFAESKLPSEFDYVVKEINLRIRSGSMGGEIGSLVGGYLKSLRDQSHPAYLMLKHEIDLYLSLYDNSIGNQRGIASANILATDFNPLYFKKQFLKCRRHDAYNMRHAYGIHS